MREHGRGADCTFHATGMTTECLIALLKSTLEDTARNATAILADAATDVSDSGDRVDKAFENAAVQLCIEITGKTPSEIPHKA
jgi:hypothetical protein